MLIDWFTVGAQALNFLILVFLMWRFLYKPILHAIDEREKRIAAELADADARRAEAQRERDEYEHKNEVLDQQRAALLRQATEEAGEERQRLLDEARRAADLLSSQRQEKLRSDMRDLSQAFSDLAQQEVFAIARKTLTDLAGASLEERVSDVFTRRLREMDSPARETLAEALESASEPALVRSAFELPAEQRAAIQKSISEAVSAEIRVRFETSPDLVSGIELTTNGIVVGWSIADYLNSLEERVGQMLEEEGRRAAKGKEKVEVDAEPDPVAAELGTARP